MMVHTGQRLQQLAMDDRDKTAPPAARRQRERGMWHRISSTVGGPLTRYTVSRVRSGYTKGGGQQG
ncbi:MAG: hypothetical protein KDE53_09015 [Caldilineaceae bacterium]|nr:hypothetical protein [Caldilineaceae bacterium]